MKIYGLLVYYAFSSSYNHFKNLVSKNMHSKQFKCSDEAFAPYFISKGKYFLKCCLLCRGHRGISVIFFFKSKRDRFQLL